MKKTLLPIAFLTAFTAVAATNTLTIIQTTDIHANLNFARLATHIARERSANRDILLIDCGDLTRGTFAATVDDGAAEVATLNALHYDVWIPGNHEFRAGQTHLRRVLEHFRSGDVLAANLSFNEAPAPRRKILPWKIYKRSGLRVAVIGLISPDRERWYGGILYRGMETRSAAEASMRNSEMFHVFQLVAYAPLLEWNMIEVIGLPSTVRLRRSRTPDPAVMLPS